MSCAVGTPVNQVRLTNVAYVRLQKMGKRFEIACYRNKVLNWRNKIETDLNEVLQIDTVFTNVSKGMLASQKDLIEYFNTSDSKLVCQEILEKGELQVSEQERQSLQESTYRDIATIVSDKVVNPENNRTYSISMIQNAMKQIHYSVSLNKNAKQQALDVIKKLKTVMPIAKACMMLRVVYPMSTEDFIISWLDSQKGQVQIVNKGTLQKSDSSHPDGETILYSDVRSDPEIFKKLEEVVKLNTKSLGRVEVLQLRVANEGLAKSMSYSNTSSTSEEKESSVAPENVFVKSGDKGGPNSTSMSSRRKHENESAKLIRDLIVSTQTGLLIDNDDEESLNEDEAINNVNNYEMSISSRKKKLKNKNKKSNIIQNELIAMESDESSENENDSSILDTTEASSAFSSSSKYVRTEGVPSKDKNIETSSSSNPKKDKKGKKTKRIEKELEIERKEKLEGLKLRVAKEQSSLREIQNSEKSLEVSDSFTPSDLTPISDLNNNLTSNRSELPGQSCNTCGGNFPDTASYRSHFRSEWHRYNLKLKMKSLPIIPSEELFLKMSAADLNI